MRTIFRILVVCSVALSLGSCLREVVVDLPQEPPKLVVTGHFEPGQLFHIQLSQTLPIEDPGVASVPSGAQVDLFKEGAHQESFVKMDNGGKIYWQSAAPAIQGTVYELRVSAPGFDPVTASSRIPIPVETEPLVFDPGAVRITPSDNGQQSMRIPLVIKPRALPREERFFAFGLRYETTVYKNGPGGPVDSVYESQAFFLADGRTLALVYDAPGNLVLVSERFWDDPSGTLEIEAVMPFLPGKEKASKLYVVWYTLSAEYYRYYLSLARQSGQQFLGNPDALYTNVQGGYGVFGGIAGHVDTLLLP